MSNSNDFWYAVNSGDARILKRCLGEPGLNLNELQDVQTPLMMAASHGHLEIVQLLVEAGADVNYELDKKLGNRTTVLTQAMACTQPSKIDIIKYLLANGSRLDALDGLRRTPLDWAVADWQCDVVKVLLDLGAKIDGVAEQIMTPLMLAARTGQTEAIDLLVRRGADINKLALHQAVLGKQPRALESLISHGANLEARDSRGCTPLIHAATEATALIEPLLKAGAAAEVAELGGHTPLMAAARNGADLSLLLQYGAKPDTQTIAGWTAMMFAAARNHANTAKQLLETGANPLLVNNEGKTAQDIALETGSTAVVALFEYLALGGGSPEDTGQPDKLGRRRL